MGKILVYTNLTTSTDVVAVEKYLGFSDYDFEFETIYYNHAMHDHSNYEKVLALIDTSCKIVSDEFKIDLVRKVRTMVAKNIQIVLCNFWESKNQIMATQYPAILKDFQFDVWHGDMTYFWFIMQDRYSSTDLNFDHSEKKYDFLYLNKAQRPHRDLLFDSLIKQNILDRSLYSYHSRGLTLDKRYEVPKYKEKYPRYGADGDIYEKTYNHTNFSLVSETSVDEMFMTEKIWKPIIARHPFVVHAKAGFLKQLQTLGFKTFTGHIDERYDAKQSLKERTEDIVMLCRSLKNKSHTNLYEVTQDIRDHNYKTFFDSKILRFHVNNSLRRFLEFADSR